MLICAHAAETFRTKHLVHLMSFFFSFFLTQGHKSRSSRRSKATESHELPVTSSCQCHVTSDTVPGASQTTRLRELLSPASCSQPPTLKPRPPSVPKVRDQPSSITCLPPTSSTANQTDPITRECLPVKKRDTHITVQTAPGKADAHTSPQKHRNCKEHTSEKAATKDQTHAPSLRSCSSSDRQSPARKTPPASHAPVCTQLHGEHNREQRMTRNEAARIIQRVWRR